MVKKEDFCDEESQRIFELRYKFYQTGDWMELIRLLGFSQRIIDRYNDEIIGSASIDSLNKKKSWMIFGCGYNGKKLFDHYLKDKVNILGFCDNALDGGHYSGKPIYTVKEAAAYKETGMIIPYSPFMYEMEKQLLELGYDADDIIILDADFLFPVKKTDHLYEILLDRNSKFVLYGTGHHESLICDLFLKAGLKLAAVCSEDSGQGKTFCSLPVISLSDYDRCYKDCYMICIGGAHYQKMIDHAADLDRVIGLANIDRLQYFDSEIIIPDEEHIFVDGGCLDLYTTNLFFLRGGVNAKKAYAFEPLKDNFELCIKNRNSWGLDGKAEIYHGALWDKEEDLPLLITPYAGSNLIDENRNADKEKDNIEIVKGLTLDQTLRGEKVTFIKLDIEGSELKALHGMAETIKKYKPILAISIYHKPEDIIQIPEYIKSLSAEYNFFLRAYHMDHTEHILYAVVRK